MARNTITSTVIVPDALSESNYKEWSNCMRNYLLAQNLWNVVESGKSPSSTDEEVTANWKRENAAVLHALQISCAPEIFDLIMGKTSAKEAWEELAKIHELKNEWHLDGPQSSSNVSELRRFFEGTIPGKTERIERARSNEFLEAIFRKKWDNVMKLLEEGQLGGKNPQFWGGFSLLHFAVISKNVELVEKLVQLMSEEEILSRGEIDCTALTLAAYNGATDIAKCLTTKNNKLLTIQETNGMIPVVRACFLRFKETTRYLYFETLEFLDPEKGEHGSLLLHSCILSEMLDIALDLLHKYPRLIFTKFKCNNKESTPIITLSAQASLFPSGTRLSFLQQWIYDRIIVAGEDIEVKAPAPSTDVCISVMTSNPQGKDTKRQVVSRPQRGLSLFFLGTRGFSSMLQNFLGVRYIYERKLIHKCASDILVITAKELLKLNAEVIKAGVVRAFSQSAQHSITEFTDILCRTNPDIVLFPLCGDESFIFYAIENRKEKYFRRFSHEQGRSFVMGIDGDGNNMLHRAAKLGPESYLAHFSGAALRMQKELQWFKEFESVVPECKGWVNHNGETPWQLFTRDHKNLLKEGEAWMKQTAQSYIIVGSLILTIMFAAAFSIPGGNNAHGFPMFSHKRLFLTYIMSDAISLFAASTSVLTFLGILTSRYTEEDFHKALPTLLIIGILTLLISVVTMLVAFCAAVSIMLQEKWWVVFSLVLLASIPTVIYSISQSWLLSEILLSTCGSGIFNRKRSFKRKGILSIMRNFTGKLLKRRE